MNIQSKALPGAILAAILMTNVAVAEIFLTSAGATFPYPIYSQWIKDFTKAHQGIEINYQSIGSGNGISQVTDGVVDFGASDGPMNDTQIESFKTRRGCEVLHFPTVLGADVPSYNVPGVTAELKFTPQALAGIFLGTITKWNDPELVKANPGVVLPNQGVIVVHRSDGSGTTYVWADYLAKISPEWKRRVGVGTTVNWPVGLSGRGNDGVSLLIRQTTYSIGYVELVYALQGHLAYGRVQNSSGNFVKADLASVTAAAASAAKTMPDDFRVSITNAPETGSYPIASFTWLLIPQKIADPVKRKSITAFLRWMLTEGQNSTEALGYARLPLEVQAKELKAISRIQ